jgi:hypothetical protein
VAKGYAVSEHRFDSAWVSEDGVEVRGGARDAFYDLPVLQKLGAVGLFAIETIAYQAEQMLGISRASRLMKLLSLPGPVRKRLGRVQRQHGHLQTIVRLHAIAHEVIPTRFDCVTTSLTLWWVLRNAGFEPELKVGVRSFGGVFDAHAWVTLDGVVLNDIRGEYRDYHEMPSPIVSG